MNINEVVDYVFAGFFLIVGAFLFIVLPPLIVPCFLVGYAGNKLVDHLEGRK